jgi:hypothetical protein
VNVFIQGLRRSGTTFLYDVFMEDPRFACYYEPLAAAVASVGGGSGEHETDLFESVRRKRATFLHKHPEWLERCPEFERLNLLNYGAPRHADLEFEPDLPTFVDQYLRHLIEGHEHTLMKFTRMYCKPHCLATIDPTAKFIHIVRDPRFVAISYLFGRGRKRERIYRSWNGKLSLRKFFGRTSSYNAWSSMPFSEWILKNAGWSVPRDPTDLGRILMVWRYVFEKTDRLGRAAFGDRYLLVRHEDVVAAPEASLGALYDAIGMPRSDVALQWMLRQVKLPGPALADGDERWQEAFTTYGMRDALVAAGYGSILS